MITYIKIDGFKSFKNFEMAFTPFTVVAGTNGSGKSNLFDALKLLSDLADSDLKQAFTNQRGEAIELFTQYGNGEYEDQMLFLVEMLVNQKVKDSWGGKAVLKHTRLRYKLVISRKSNNESINELYIKEERLENIKHSKDLWIKSYIPKQHIEYWRPKVKTGKRGKPYIETELKNKITTINLHQDGRPGGGKRTSVNVIKRTVLSRIDDVNFPHAFAAREEMKNWKFLQLNPDDLRKPTKKEIGMSDVITQSGENLAAALYRIQTKDKFFLKEISRKLNNLLPNLIEVNVIDDKVNNQYLIEITSEDGKKFTSRVLSEGTLRLLTLCIFMYDDKHNSLLCYEEPENGIHPFRIKFLTALLNDLGVDFSDRNMPLRQILINTHSPKLVGEIINWQSDNRVSIWFSQLTTLITEKDNEKKKIAITKILPVIKNYQPQLNLQFPNIELKESEIKLTLANVKEYLETTDQGQIINAL